MAKKKQQPAVEENLGFDSVEQTLTKTEQFLENNARQVGIAVGAIVAVVFGIVCLQHIYTFSQILKKLQKKWPKPSSGSKQILWI